MSTPKARRIWILNHHASGNQDRHDSIARRLTELGAEVIIIASSYDHSEHKHRVDDQCLIQDRNGLRYIWLRTIPAYKSNGFARILNMLSYLQLVRRYAKQWWQEFGKPDVVIGSSVHPLAWEAAYWISEKNGALFFAEIRDLWPLSLIEVRGISPMHPIVWFFQFLERRACSRAVKIITTMPLAYKYIADKLDFSREKVVWIPNGIDTDRVDRVLTEGEVKLPEDLDYYLSEHWCAVYAGSLAESECVDYILDAALVLQTKGISTVKFAIIGDGKQQNQLYERAERYSLNNVRFFGRITKDQVSVAVSKAKVCLAAIRNLSLYKYGISMNKLCDYLYSGNPTIFACDVDNVVKSSGGGVAVPFGNAELMAEAIKNIFSMSETDKLAMVEGGKNYIHRQYSIKSTSSQLLSLVNSEILGKEIRK